MAESEPKRVNTRMHPDVFENLKYWADKRGMSLNDYIVEAILFKIGWENQDYPLPTMEQQRLFQVVAVVTSLDETVANLAKVFTSGMDSLLNMSRGDSPLTDEDDGELAGSSAGSLADGGPE